MAKVKIEDKCFVKYCRKVSEVIYLGQPLCDYHWEMESNKKIK